MLLFMFFRTRALHKSKETLVRRTKYQGPSSSSSSWNSSTTARILRPSRSTEGAYAACIRIPLFPVVTASPSIEATNYLLSFLAPCCTTYTSDVSKDLLLHNDLPFLPSFLFWHQGGDGKSPGRLLTEPKTGGNSNGDRSLIRTKELVAGHSTADAAFAGSQFTAAVADANEPTLAKLNGLFGKMCVQSPFKISQPWEFWLR